ncbi:hypothetical protein DY120_07325 [Apilactobacillus micheneri]|uniref:Uncharacterized protein n=1 Tax=Apilactobacillus micheneri TaxID=1899430 RepID=A0ABY2YVJ6_9LACO|nr:hypothetical protein [Apilactobacillus micheneri]TPR23109.1 hypothetical protein DY114_07310 [Apilactobacillus micheneri]TPR24427.1 hypothetical protein DY111_07325 [Apilactobacillus micheneri]TPR29374.1 hypothetical protein DY120_07325 [Apilactobacillus micheneri]TPR34581.1 hypothetical protein DY027_07315 [Apilactobacillus micheneri]
MKKQNKRLFSLLSFDLTEVIKKKKLKSKIQFKADQANNKNNLKTHLKHKKQYEELQKKNEQIQKQNKKLQDNILFYLLNNGISYVQAKEVLNNSYVEITERMNKEDVKSHV